MNIDYIKSTGGFIKGMFFTLIVSLMALSSCSDDAIERQEPTPPNPNNQNADVLFEVNMPHSTVPTTYALTPTQENDIKSIEIILFKIDGTNKTYTGKPYYCDKIENIAGGSISAKKRFSVSLPKGGPYDIVILANSRQEVENILVTSKPTVTDKDDVLALLTATHAGKWISDTNDLNYKPIPMWGEMGGATVAENLRFDVDLIRMMAKIDVEITTDAQPDFVLFAVHLVKANTAGHIVPAPGNLNAGLAVAPTLISPLPTPSTLTYLSSDHVGGDKALKGIIYTFEASKAAATSLPDATCVVLQGSYKGQPDNFYRVDFGAKDAGGVVTYLDILRNFRYDVKIKSISGTGHTNLDDAIKNPSTNIIANLVVWDNNELPIVVSDNKYTLGLSADDITTSFLASNENRLKVMTDYTGGWKIDKIEYDASSGTGWFDALPKTPTVGSEGVMADIKFGVTENPSIDPRICYIYISAGPLTHKIKVTQKGLMRLSNIVWVDYDGANDVDTRLATITVEQTGATVATQISNIANGAIQTPINVDGTITKITLTYSGYALDVPVAKYSMDALTKTLTVTDRTLIGKAVHMDNIRLDLKGSYIQVSDVDLAIYTNWVPIGVNNPVTSRFAGSYYGGDGNSGAGYKIYNLNIDRDTENLIGLFGCAVGATFKNIHIASGAIKGLRYAGGICGSVLGLTTITDCSNNIPITTVTGDVGGICGSSTAKIINCHNLVNGIVNGTSRLGGICGENAGSGSIENCTNAAAISKKDGGAINVGGICGSNKTLSNKITKCHNLAGANINGAEYVGGICGFNYGTVELSTNSATITGTGSSTRIGGICGTLNASAKITECKNLANANVSGVTNIGGICGYAAKDVTIEDCSNAATVTGAGASMYAAGICGYNTAGSKITRCKNLVGGNVSGSGQHTGGICGSNYGTVELSTNAAKVTAGGINAGGIAGWNNGTTANITDCDNLTGGIIEGTNQVGGICGHNTGNISSCKNNETISGSSFTGGICGLIYGAAASIQICKNLAGGKVSGLTRDTGGIVGNNNMSAILGCSNKATVDGIISVGGICGYNSNSGSIKSCENAITATIKGSDYVAGICGWLYGGTLAASYSLATVTTSNTRASAIYNSPGSTGTATDCYFGGGANGMLPVITGTLQFADGVWPLATTPGWELTTEAGYWMKIGGWYSGGASIEYPALAP